jgi:hypothetical protein
MTIALVMVALLAVPASGVDGRTCPDFAQLDESVIESLLQLVPGTPLSSLGKDPRITEVSLSSAASGEKERRFLVTARTASGAAQTAITCTFSSADVLLACHAQLGIAHTTWVTQDQVDALRLGNSMSTVVTALCPPAELRVTGSDGILLRYFIPLKRKADEQFAEAYVDLVFGVDGRLKHKDSYVQ